MSIKKLAVILSLTLATSAYAAPMEQIDLDVNAKVYGKSDYKVDLSKLSDIAYTVTCTIDNSTYNPSLPLEYYPETGAVTAITINGQDAGSGKEHHPVNIPRGTSLVEMYGVTKSENSRVVVKNDSAYKDTFITITECHANS